MAKQRKDYYQAITNTIVEAMERGPEEWAKPWKSAGSSLPENAVTGSRYKGINVFLLWIAQEMKGYTDHRWLTFKQARDLGGSVRKGEKNTEIVRWLFRSQCEECGEWQNRAKACKKCGHPLNPNKVTPVLKTHNMFNVEQCDGLRISPLEVQAIPDPQELVEAAEAVLGGTSAQIRHGAGGAYYRPSTDLINLPHRADFQALGGYYSTAFHEMAHWTGAESRLDRDLTGRFGDESYAMEELVAELASAFLCARTGVEGSGLQHPAYLSNWIQVLKNDNKAIFTAMSAATKACEYVLEDAEEVRMAA